MTPEVAASIAAAVAVLGYVYLAIVSVVLAVIDVREHRLPNRIVLPSIVIALALFVVAAAIGADPARLVRAIAGMVILFAAYFVMRWASPSSLGGGDVKLAALIGVYLGWISWEALLIGTVGAFVIGGVHALVVLLSRRADRRTRIPFGPALLAGAWVAIAAGAAVPLAEVITTL